MEVYRVNLGYSVYIIFNSNISYITIKKISRYVSNYTHTNNNIRINITMFYIISQFLV